MRSLALTVGLLGLVMSGPVWAAAYLMTDGTVVDPILDWDTRLPHAYSGANLEPLANLAGVQLGWAELEFADLEGAILTNASLNNVDLHFASLKDTTLIGANLDNSLLDNATLSGANLETAILSATYFRYANLQGANLSGTDFTGVRLTGADVSGADLTNSILVGAVGLDHTIGSAFYNVTTDFTNAWADTPGGPLFDPVAAGWTFIPEPSTALLLGVGLAGLGMRRRRTRRGC